MLALFNSLELLSSSSDKAKLLPENLYKNCNLDDPGISLLAFPSIITLKLHNTAVTSKLVKKFIMNVDMPKASGQDCIPVVVLENCEPELSNRVAEIFNKCLIESCFSDFWKASSVISYLRMLGKGLQLKINASLVFFMGLVKSLKNF